MNVILWDLLSIARDDQMYILLSAVGNLGGTLTGYKPIHVLSGHPCCVVKGIDILKLKNCLFTTIIYLDVKGRLLHVSACGHLQVGSLDF
jgi:hypothetical protein